MSRVSADGSGHRSMVPDVMPHVRRGFEPEPREQGRAGRLALGHAGPGVGGTKTRLGVTEQGSARDGGKTASGERLAKPVGNYDVLRIPGDEIEPADGFASEPAQDTQVAVAFAREVGMNRLRRGT